MKYLMTLLGSAGLLAAQSYYGYYPRHNFTFGAGAASPRAELGGRFVDRPGISLGYGYRFQRFLQADLGLDAVFGAGQVRDYYETPLGPSRIRDYQFFVPLGGRGIIPLAGGRLLFSGGGGGAYARYTELLHQLSDYYRVDCPVCNARGGWGYYALLGAETFLDRGRHFRLGATGKVYRVHTEGDRLGPLPGWRTRDHWVQIYGQVGFSF